MLEDQDSIIRAHFVAESYASPFLRHYCLVVFASRKTIQPATVVKNDLPRSISNYLHLYSQLIPCFLVASTVTSPDTGLRAAAGRSNFFGYGVSQIPVSDFTSIHHLDLMSI